MSLAILFHFLCAQHVSDINISTHATILLNYHTGRIVLGSMRVGVSVWLGWSGLYTSPAKKWSSTPPLMIPRSNGRSEVRKLCLICKSTKSRPTDVNIIPD